VPLARRQGWTETKAFARAVAADLARRLPDAFTINAARAARRGKIYLDYLRNGRGATAVAAYSSRARPGAPIRGSACRWCVSRSPRPCVRRWVCDDEFVGQGRLASVLADSLA
jgi:hypothetical protein